MKDLSYAKQILIVGKNTSRIDKLNKQLSKLFVVKDLGHAKHILSMMITR